MPLYRRETYRRPLQAHLIVPSSSAISKSLRSTAMAATSGEGWDVQNVTVDWGTTRQQNDQNQRPTPRD